MLVGVTMTEDEPAAVRRRAAARRRRQRRHRPRRPLRRAPSTACTRVDALADPQPLDAWAAAIAAAADALTAATGARDAWQRARARSACSTTSSPRDDRGGSTRTTLALPEVRALLADRLQGRPTRANFRTGHLTICTLVPMRSVPHRVVCLLGLDDGVFPRKAPRDGDDLLLATTRTSATATRAPRTASCCSTRCWPRPTA